MIEQSAGDPILKAEWKVLRAMGGGARELSSAAARGLKSYRWRSLFHQAIFESLSKLLSSSSEASRERLPELLTRKGFPDVDWNDFFSPLTLSRKELEQLLETLRKDD